MNRDYSTPPLLKCAFGCRSLPWLLFVAALLLTVPGCNGCLKNPLGKKKTLEDLEKQLEKRSKKKEAKPDFEMGRLAVRPSAESELVRNEVKPGHWIAARRPMVANNFDVLAELRSASTDRNGQVVEVEHTPFQLTLSRPGSLPKGQPKNFELLYFVPRYVGRQGSTAWLQSRILAARGDRELASAMEPTVYWPAHRYAFVLVTDEPDSYGFLPRLDCIAPPYDSLLAEDEVLYYQIVQPREEDPVPLPEHPLTWTSIAYVLWDGTAPQQLSPAQQQSLLDWIHWGGQLIVNGPRSLDALNGSFLEPYLPATKVEAVELGPESFSELAQQWTVPAGNQPSRPLRVLDEKPLVGVSLEVHPDASSINGTGGLVVERRVGSGRIVLTAFSLASREVVNWSSFDSFVNGCLLRRPEREYVVDENAFARTRFARFSGDDLDPRFSSSLRYFTHDILPPRTDAEANGGSGDPFAAGKHREDWRFGGYGTWSGAGVAGWNDASGAANAVRRSLRDAAGISIPRSGFVLRVLALYLLVLVPVNWGIFRAMGRVEWAWVAAPLIAIVGAVAVVRVAQLDIGFARSRTEISVVEAHGGYDRAHLTRFTALYSSLGTGYELEFADASALAQPFAVDLSYTRQMYDTAKEVTLRRDRLTRLTGFQVDSNTTGMVRSEQFLDLEAGVQLLGDDQEGFQLANGTPLRLLDVGVLRRTENGLQGAWIGTSESGTSAPLRWRPLSEAWLPEWDESSALADASVAQQGEVSLRELFQLASRQLNLQPGDVRLIGWSDAEMPGVSVEPRASQTVFRTLVLVHLDRGRLPDANRDRNLRPPTQDLDLDTMEVFQ